MKVSIAKLLGSWFKSVLNLFIELILFIVNIPKYLYQFFKGLRLFSQSYTGIIEALEVQKDRVNIFIDANPTTNTAAKIMTEWINENIRLQKEHENMFSSLFGILIAVLALFISILALLLSR